VYKYPRTFKFDKLTTIDCKLIVMISYEPYTDNMFGHFAYRIHEKQGKQPRKKPHLSKGMNMLFNIYTAFLLHHRTCVSISYIMR